MWHINHFLIFDVYKDLVKRWKQPLNQQERVFEIFSNSYSVVSIKRTGCNKRVGGAKILFSTWKKEQGGKKKSFSTRKKDQGGKKISFSAWKKSSGW